MRYSAIVVLSAAALAVASPAAELAKRKLEVDWVTVYDTVYVTAGQAQPTSVPPAPVAEVVTVTKYPSVEPPVVVAPTYQAPAPAPSPTTKENAPAPTATYGPPASGDMQGTALYHHNMHRSNHSAPAMTWQDDIANAAQQAADTCVFEHRMGLDGLSYGQNIAMWGTSNNAASLGADGAIAMASTDMWYNGEFQSYASYFGEEPNMGDFHSWGHLSQLVWAGSTGLGCSAKLCKAGTMFPNMDAWYMVCNYYPAGNVGGSYAKNVKKPLGEAVLTA